MSLYTNDLDTVQECFGDGILMFCDALFLGLLAVIKMWRMNHFLTGLSMIPMAFLMAAGTTLGKYLMKKWEERQAAFPSCPISRRKTIPVLLSSKHSSKRRKS